MPHESRSPNVVNASSRAAANNQSSLGISRPAVPVIQLMIGDGGILIWGKKVKHKTGKIFTITGDLVWLNKVHYKLVDEGGSQILVAFDDPDYKLYDPSSDKEEDDDDDHPDDGKDIYGKYPKITHPVLRPGHMNPYRHGIGAADTISLLAVDRKRLIARVGGDNPKLIALIEEEFAKLDALIKAINDKEEKPLLEQMNKLRAELNRLEDKSIKGGMDVDTSEQEALLFALEMKLDAIRNGVKKEYREQLRRLYEKIFWISQKNYDDRDALRREQQVKEVYNLAKEAGFELSFQRANEHKEENFDEEEGPLLTAHHSEQRMIVSAEWLKLRTAIMEDVKNAIAEGQGHFDEVIANISQMIVSMLLNRSSCYTCNAFLVAELISLWKEIAQLLKCSWQEARDALRDIIVFEVAYSVPYSDVKDVHELDEQLQLAGWTVNPSDAAEASDDEAVHEKLSAGREVSSDMKKKKRKRSNSQHQKKDTDEDEFIPLKKHKGPEIEEKQPLYHILTSLTRSIKIEGALLDFFKQLVKINKGVNVMTVLTDLGFVHHGQPGTGLDCALFSIADQLKRRHNIVIADLNGFTAFVRKKANLPFNTMIDVLNSGQAVLAAVAAYLTENGLVVNAPGLSISVLANDNQEGLMEYNNVAVFGGGGHVLVLYYNGFNHFDSLSGGWY